MSHWITISWYKYLFSRSKHSSVSEWITAIICRVKGHPNGTVFFNVNGEEPDDTCQDCGDYI